MQRKTRILVSPDFPHDLTSTFFKMERLGGTRLLPFYARFFPVFMRMYFLSFSFDIIITARRDGKFLGLLYYFFKPAHLKHIVYEFIYEQEQSLRATLSMHIWKAALKRLDCVTVQSTAEIRHYARLFGMDRAKFVYVPIPVEAGNFIGPTTDGFILSAGKTNRDYELLHTVLAKTKHPWVILAGEKDRGLLRGLPDHLSVRFDVGKKRYCEFLAACKLVVITLKNGISSRGQVVLLEAMAMGKPVICTDVPPIRDYAGDGSSCVLVPPGNGGALVEKIEHLLSHENELNRIARNGYDRVKRLFSSTEFLVTFETMVRNVLQI